MLATPGPAPGLARPAVAPLAAADRTRYVARMLFALRLGPVETNTGPIRIYFGGTDDDMLVKPCAAASDAEGLRILRERVKFGPFLCEEALALAGRAHGFAVADPPAWLLKQRAALAVSMANRRTLEGVAPAAILELLEASVAFWRAEPWRHVDSDDTLHARLVSPSTAVYEASILGSAGQEFGMALYEGKNALATIRRAKDELRFPRSRRQRGYAAIFVVAASLMNFNSNSIGLT